jgi:glycosyltransferase involved in cell wall biosynthesis
MCSIITVNKNNAIGLERTCQSVICQNYENFEWLVIDGASTDNSVDIIKNYSNKMTYWVSEPDKGIYNAMNKGIRHAKGNYCLFLNSGDWLISYDSIKRAFSIIRDSGEADIYYGNCMNSDSTSWGMPNKISIDYLYLQAMPSHQNTFIKRSLFFDHEFYNENYHTVSDSVFFVKEHLLYHSKFVYINTFISVYSLGGISDSNKISSQKELHNEMRIIMGDSEFNILAKCHELINSNATRETQKQRKHIIKNIIKYLLPYGIVRFIQKYVLK